MTRIEAEDLILEKLREIREIALRYSPEDDYLTMFFKGGHISLDNGLNAHRKLICWENVLDGTGVYRQGLEVEKDAEEQT